MVDKVGRLLGSLPAFVENPLHTCRAGMRMRPRSQGEAREVEHGRGLDEANLLGGGKPFSTRRLR